MDKISIKELLESTFGDMFLFHPEFLIEYDELIKESGEVRKINKLLVRRLYAIIELGDPDDGLPWLEHLKAYDNMYSLHINTNTQNYRLLFSKSSNKKYFLHMFYERSGKKKSSYESHVPIAISRRDNN
ncbi:MAG: hypothetical protein IKJ68_03805 [Clostridia bacterium]|nr:hypothetical protein [Clostridia bacterium]